MTKEQAHLILDKAKIDRLTPIYLINQALITLGDLDVRTTDPEISRTLRDYGVESRFIRSRSASSPFTPSR